MRRRSVWIVAVVGVLAAIGIRAVSAADTIVERKGRYRVWYTSPEIRAELDYHWADGHLGDEWLVLKLSMAAGSRGVTSVSREGVRVQTPNGDVLSLPDQDGFREALGKVRMALERENAWGPSSSRFSRSLVQSEEWFFSPPGAYFNRENVFPSPFRYCSGPLIFLVPGGVQPGGWMLTIGLEEGAARIPFVLGENR